MPAHAIKNPIAHQHDQLAILQQLDHQWEEANQSIQAREQQLAALQQRLTALHHLLSFQQADHTFPTERLGEWVDRLAKQKQVIEQLLEQERNQQRHLEDEFDAARLLPSKERQQAMKHLVVRRTPRQFVIAVMHKTIGYIWRLASTLSKRNQVEGHPRQTTSEDSLYLF
jgi:DNA repair ATPase RecN